MPPLSSLLPGGEKVAAQRPDEGARPPLPFLPCHPGKRAGACPGPRGHGRARSSWVPALRFTTAGMTN